MQDDSRRPDAQVTEPSATSRSRARCSQMLPNRVERGRRIAVAAPGVVPKSPPGATQQVPDIRELDRVGREVEIGAEQGLGLLRLLGGQRRPADQGQHDFLDSQILVDVLTAPLGRIDAGESLFRLAAKGVNQGGGRVQHRRQPGIGGHDRLGPVDQRQCRFVMAEVGVEDRERRVAQRVHSATHGRDLPDRDPPGILAEPDRVEPDDRDPFRHRR